MAFAPSHSRAADDRLVAHANGGIVTIWRVGATLEPASEQAFQSPVRDMAWDRDGTLVVLLDNLTLWRLVGTERQALRKPHATEFRLNECPSDEPDCQRWRVAFPSRWLHLVPTQDGMSLGDCVLRGGEAHTGCGQWRYVSVTSKRPAQSELARLLHDRPSPLESSGRLAYYPPPVLRGPADVRLSTSKDPMFLLRCERRQQPPVAVPRSCSRPDNAPDGGACTEFRGARWVSVDPPMYVATEDDDVSGEAPTPRYLLLRACDTQPIAIFEQVVWGPDGAWAYSTNGHRWTVRQRGTEVGALIGASTPVFRPPTAAALAGARVLQSCAWDDNSKDVMALRFATTQFHGVIAPGKRNSVAYIFDRPLFRTFNSHLHELDKPWTAITERENVLDNKVYDAWATCVIKGRTKVNDQFICWLADGQPHCTGVQK